MNEYHVKVHSNAEEERQSGGELVDSQTGFEAGATVFDAISHGETQF